MSKIYFQFLYILLSHRVYMTRVYTMPTRIRNTVSFLKYLEHTKQCLWRNLQCTKLVGQIL